MASASVKEFSMAWWSEVCNRVIGAAVFIDEAIAECLHWEGGMFNLLLSGAKCVKLLSPFEHCPLQYQKAVFITQSEMGQLNLMREIIQNATLTHCTLISTISLEVVYCELVKDQSLHELVASGQAPQNAILLLTEKICQWMRSSCGGVQNVIGQALHLPIFTISMTNVIFTTPPFACLYPANNNELLKEAIPDLRALHVEERSRVRRLACALNSMLDSMNLKEDVYFMGNYSSLVAGVLENSPIYINRRKNCLKQASLLIIDRTLDLCGVASHSSESVFDKMRSVLPAYPGQCSEVAVDMSPICHANSSNHPHDIHMSPGCVYHAGYESSVQTFEHMINKTQKEVMLEMYNKLSKMNVNKSPSPENLMKVTPQSLEKIINATKGHYDVIYKNLDLLQQGLALVQMHKSPKRAAMDLLMNLEKQVMQSLATSRESTSVLTQIAHLINTRKQRGLPLENLVGLLVHVYSLTGTEFPFAQPHQTEIYESLTAALMDEWQALHAQEITIEKAREIAEAIMERLNEIKFMRKSITKYNSLLKACESGDGFEYKGLVQQLVEDLVNTTRPEMPDLQRRTDALKDLLRTGLSMLNISGKKPASSKHPLDNETVIIFIIGGTNSEECKRLHRTVITSGVDNTVLFGSTRFLTPHETAHLYTPL